MATKTLGTLTTTSLTALQWPPKYNATPQTAIADFATLQQDILNDQVNDQQLWTKLIYPGALYGQNEGTLYVPNRGILQIHPGDWVAVDQSGWPILISKTSLAQTLTTTGNTSNSSSTVSSLAVNVLTLGWWSGMLITGTGISAGTYIGSIAANGLSLTLVNSANVAVNAASNQTGTTLTASSWTHS